MTKKLVHWFLSGYDSPARFTTEPLLGTVIALALTAAAAAYYLMIG